ncbi:MAG: hypothetical protein HP497_12760 [Nitrospira sp.]|nr:hypothetical protein [Nitrospira sp.]
MDRFCPAHDIPEFDCTDCSKVAKIRQAAEAGRVELASMVLVDTLEAYVDVILKAIGYPEALVTDPGLIGTLP